MTRPAEQDIKYFHVGKKGIAFIAPGDATLLRNRGKEWSYLYIDGSDHKTMEGSERVPETKFYWGRWLESDMRGGGYPMVKEIGQVEAFDLIARAAW